MQVLAHPDPFVLEGELLRRVRQGAQDEPLARTLILVPTRRLADHIRGRLVGDGEALLGVEVLPHRALVLASLGQGPTAPPRSTSPRLLSTVLAGILEKLPRNPWAELVRRRPGARRSLFTTIAELREARIPAAAVASAAGKEATPRDLAEIYAAYEKTLAGMAGRGLVDEAGLVDLALQPAVEHVRRRGYRAIFHHGAYELIGIHLELLRRLDQVTPITFLLPAEPGAPAYAYAEAFASRFLLGETDEMTRLEDPQVEGGLLGSRLACLYDEEAVPPPLVPEAGVTEGPGDTGVEGPGDDSRPVFFQHAQGPVSEVAAAVRRLLAAAGKGEAPREMALVGRHLESYAVALEEVFRREGIPWTSSLPTPLRRQPRIHAFLRMLRILVEDFPRAPTAEWLASPHIHWRALCPDGPLPDGEQAEAWSRSAGLIGGLAEWTDDLPAWASRPRQRRDAADDQRRRAAEQAGQRGERARRLADALATLAATAAAATHRRWSEHAACFESLFATVIREHHHDPDGESVPDPAGARMAGEALAEILGDMRALESLLQQTDQVSFETAVSWLEEAVDAARLPTHAEDSGGLRVLDAMQARGLTFSRLVFIGMHSGLFPRTPREDPLLPDAVRRKLREATGQPLPVKLEGDDEERLLLAMLLGSSRKSVGISWQRADEAGRNRMASLALREVGRVVLGRPDVDHVIGPAAARLYAHPQQFLDGLMRTTGLLSSGDREILEAFRSRSPREAAAALGELAPGLRDGLEMLVRTETFKPGDRTFDGQADTTLELKEPHGVSSLDTLGRCPLRYFFRHVLRVEEPDDEASAFGPSPREMGLLVHEVLETVYRRLEKEDLLGAANLDSARKAGRAFLEEAWNETLGSIQQARTRRLPVFWNHHARQWLQSLESFLIADLERLVRHEWTLEDLEVEEIQDLNLGNEISLPVRGRFDRLLRQGASRIVGDYKTGGIEYAARVTSMLKGRTLQVPLYWILAGGGSRVELLGVGPRHQLVGLPLEEQRAGFPGFDEKKDKERKQLEGLLQTLLVLARLLEKRRFPLTPDPSSCRSCPYTASCRRNHPPTAEREEMDPLNTDFRNLEGKSTRNPLLPAGGGSVRGGGA